MAGLVVIFIDLSLLPIAGEVTIFMDICPLPYGRSSHDIYRSQSTALWMVKSQYVLISVRRPMAGLVMIFIDLSQLPYGW